MAVGYELLHLCKPMRNCHSITYVYRFEYSSATARKYGNAHGQSRLRHFTYIYLLMISNWFLCKPCIGTVLSMTGSIRLQTEIFMCASTSVGSSATCYRRHSGLTWRCIQSNTFQLNQAADSAKCLRSVTLSQSCRLLYFGALAFSLQLDLWAVQLHVVFAMQIAISATSAKPHA